MTESPPPIALFPDADGVLAPHPTGLLERTNDEYHSGPGTSKSHLDTIAAGSPLHYWQKYINPEREPNKPTPEMIMGQAVHIAILEPDLFPQEVIESPGFDRRTKNGKAGYEEFYAQHAGKIVLEPEDFMTCLRVRDAVHRHPVAAGLLRGGKAEQSFYAHDQGTGELIKCRTDYIHDSGRMIVDVKTTKDASPEGFGKSAANLRYTVQTAWYHRVLDAAFGEHPKDWVFLAVEKEPPYAIGVYFTEVDQVERAAIAAQRNLETIAACRQSGQWPDWGFEPRPLALPGWSKL
jgi:exodeoxyribonuclease VIII